MLDSTKARQELGWQPLWDLTTALTMTASWYRQFYDNHKIVSAEQLDNYISMAETQELEWFH